MTPPSGRDHDQVIRAAGAVLWRPGPEGRPEVALVHRPKYDDWSLPKGKLDPGEHVVTAAVREVREETGQRAVLGVPLGLQRYVDAYGRPKEVRYWAARAVGDDPFEPTAEIDDVRWLTVKEAAARLSYDRDAGLLQHFADRPRPTWSIVLLRHAAALPRKGWRGPNPERPLDDAGRAQAERLVPLLSAYGIEHIVSSDACRCVDSVQPFSAAAARPVELVPALSEERYAARPGDVEEAAHLLLAARVPTVVCSHRPVLPDLLAALAAGSDVDPPRPALPAGACWVLHISDNGVIASEMHIS